jgi:hypothetical protein
MSRDASIGSDRELLNALEKWAEGDGETTEESLHLHIVWPRDRTLRQTADAIRRAIENYPELHESFVNTRKNKEQYDV